MDIFSHQQTPHKTYTIIEVIKLQHKKSQSGWTGLKG